MRVVIDIAKAELRRLFFSPVAFLLLVILTFLMGSYFIDSTGFAFFPAFAYGESEGLSTRIFGLPVMGYYEPLLKYIYLFFPVLTMNIMSRDMGSGAFKLMQSSPVTDRQIVLGKYFSLVVFNILLAILIYIFALYAIAVIDKVEVPLSLSGLLGVFLLCCAYSAIGLFMSSLTGMPIVAAIGTLCLLVFLSYCNEVWQEYPVIRDITYWLSLKGRAKTFYHGLITSEDLIYFFAVVIFFLSLTTIKLSATRVKRSKKTLFGQYATAIIILFAVGYFTSLPRFKTYLDVTRTKQNTLSRESQKVVSKLEGGLTITTYSNLFDGPSYQTLPRYQKKDEERFKEFTRFKPELKLKYVYYYKSMPGHSYESYKGKSDDEIMDTVRKLLDIGYKVVPYKEIQNKVDLSGEGFRTVRLVERENGQKTFLRVYDDPYKYPNEREITAALKRVAEPLPKVGFVTGHGERTGNMESDRGYSLFTQEKTFRYSLLNNGFDFEEVSLMAPVPDHIDILVIADARKPFTDTEEQHYKNYIDRGGNMLICGEPGREDIMNRVGKLVGVSFIPGVITQKDMAVGQDLQILKRVANVNWEENGMKIINKLQLSVMMNGANGISVDSHNQFTQFPIYSSDSSEVWNELETKDFTLDSAVFNPAAGEVKKPYLMALGMERKVNGKSQKIMVTGDADWINNTEVGRSRKNYQSGNFPFISNTFYWLSDRKVPIDTSRDPFTDNKVKVSRNSWKYTVLAMQWTIPALLLAAGLLTWIRRKGR